MAGCAETSASRDGGVRRRRTWSILGPTRPLLLRLHVTIDEQPFRQVWQARFDELFDNEDRTRTGRITVEQGDAIARDMNGGLRDTPRSVAKDSQLRSVADEQTARSIEPTLLAYMTEVAAAVWHAFRAV